MIPKNIIIIVGPTAVGKTAAAIELARQFNTEIISADSRQCYRELKIGVARPAGEELSAVPHHFIASHSIHEEVTAAGFEKFALTLAENLFQQHDTIIMVGGTGLYIKAFCEGLDAIPAVDPSIRQRIMTEYAEKGIQWLQDEIKQKDPLFYQNGEMQNPQRLMRALEVVESTHSSIFSFRKNERAKRDFNITTIGIELPREELHQRIYQRVEQMIDKGLVEEVRSLLPHKHLNALRTVGYSEIFDFLEGKISLEKAIEQIKINTRQYAKRQLTWFRRDPDIRWVKPSSVSSLFAV